jgi:16S rRNA G966 N2-methylase RsmD
VAENTLYYGDNLDVLRQHIEDESVDLVYLDPPFNSFATYNGLFSDRRCSVFSSNSNFGINIEGCKYSLLPNSLAERRSIIPQPKV